MAVIKQGILGGFQNKVGSVVGSSWKGIAVMKAKPLSVANPRTVGQVQQRNKFGGLAQFLSPMVGTICKPLWDRFAGQKSGYNAILQANINNVTGEGNPSGSLFVLSRGKIAKTEVEVTAIVGEPYQVSLSWPTTITGVQSATDELYVMVHRTLSGDSWSASAIAVRSAGAITIDFEAIGEPSSTFFIYTAFRRADGTAVSDGAGIQYDI
jgi:hypothetical protein